MTESRVKKRSIAGENCKWPPNFRVAKIASEMRKSKAPIAPQASNAKMKTLTRTAVPHQRAWLWALKRLRPPSTP